MSTSNFELLTRDRIPSLGMELAQYRHQPTGARHYHLACDDANNAFMVAFPTLPEDSTGVAHILEHTTLCGSERYPVRDPFFMMLRRSLNTYMNAFTTADSTAYPFATQNRKDFDNLLGVYLDAVFFPRLDPLDFAQEGWRVELADAATEPPALEFHGVVYNEMKGAMSAPLAQLWQHVHTALFPHTVYRHNSGGDPLAIPDLTHAALTEFHARHYHPSHAVFMTYGSFPAAEHQARFEQLALARFDAPRAPLVSAPQTPFASPQAVATVYASDDPDQPANTHIVWAWACGDAATVDDVIELHLLGSLLLEHGASPLRHYLETTPLAEAPSELCGVDDSARQLVFICGVEGSAREHAEALERGMFEVFERLARDGLAPAEVEAAIDRLEMAQRDIGGDGYPFGLQLMGRMLPAAMYRGDPRRLLDLDPVLGRLREALENPRYVCELVRRVLLDNAHRVRVLMAPDPDKAARDEAAEAARLRSLSAALDAAGVARVRTAAAALAARQSAPDDASLLPRVTLADVPPPVPLLRPRATASTSVPLNAYECATNGIFRCKLAYRLPALSPAELDLLPLWCEYLTELGCGAQDYLAVQERRARFGSFSAYALVRPGPRPDSAPAAWLVVNGKGLARKYGGVIECAAEMVENVRFDEHARLHELLLQARAEAEQSLSDRGHQLAVLAAARTLSAAAALDERWDGPSAVRLLKHYAQAGVDSPLLGEFAATCAAIRAKLAAAPREIALIGEPGVLADAERLCAPLAQAAAPAAPFALPSPVSAADDAWIINAQVNFCAQAYRAVHESETDAAPLAVLGRYVQDGFLHREIREKGGAYGSGAGYDADSQTFRLFSYRDPRTSETFADFERALEWAATDRDGERLEESILGTVRALDQPRSPAGEAERAFAAHLCGRDDATRRAFREAVLGVTHAALDGARERHLERTRRHRSALGGAASEAAFAAAGLPATRL